MALKKRKCHFFPSHGRHRAPLVQAGAVAESKGMNILLEVNLFVLSTYDFVNASLIFYAIQQCGYGEENVCLIWFYVKVSSAGH